MREQTINKQNEGQIIFDEKYFTSQKSTKFKFLYDSKSRNTVILVNIERGTSYEAKEFYDYVSNLLKKGQNKLIIDLESVYFLDSVFFGTLIKLLKETTKANGYLSLIVNYKNKPEILSINQFEGIFETYPNLFEALSHSKFIN